MKKAIHSSLMIIIIASIALFIFENMQFNQYTSYQKNNETEDMNISINEDAPVKSYAEIEIAAPAEKVWQILTTINDWPTWQSEVTEANLREDLKEGSEFKWKAGGLSFSSKIHTVSPKIKFGWTGRTFGASAIHNWYFEEEGEKTVIKVEESLQGVFPQLFKDYFQNNLDKGVQKNLHELKRASEK
ncbi:SRPBCC family protein [Pontibacter sp. H249]|uniref:SRPBCC family protein n=1 Tax=Pontibacter sp. H249 TaxID=3133420 RepID=UPI0030BE6F0B